MEGELKTAKEELKLIQGLSSDRSNCSVTFVEPGKRETIRF